MPVTLTYTQLKALQPCEDSLKRVVKLMGGARKWNGTPISAEQAKDAGCTFSDIIWAASTIASTAPDVQRRLRLWMADCAAHVLHIYEKTGASDAPRNAITASRQFARGEIGAAARDAARDAAGAAARDAAGAAAWAAAWDAAGAAARDAAGAAAWAAAGAAARAAAWDAAGAAEESWQFDRLIAWLSDEEPQDWPLPEAAHARELAKMIRR